jgi:hypothetical protein
VATPHRLRHHAGALWASGLRSGPRYQPLAALWDDGTIVRLRCPSRLVTTYVRGKADEAELAAFWLWVDAHADEPAAAQPRFVLDSDEDVRTFTIWRNGRELSRAWMMRDREGNQSLARSLRGCFGCRFAEQRRLLPSARMIIRPLVLATSADCAA